MANNLHANIVKFGDQTVIDLTGDTVTEADVRQGVSFHLPSGAPGIGTADEMDFIGKRTHFASDGSIEYTYGNGQRIVQDFPSDAITRYRLYDANNTLIATKTTAVEAATGDIVDTVVR